MSNAQIEIQRAKLLSDKELAEIRELLGEILLALQCPLTPKEQQDLWQFFELLLERYIKGKKRE